MTDYEPRVDMVNCIGCGLCPDMMGEVFRIPDHKGRAYVYDDETWRSLPDGEERLVEAAANCPTGAIHIEPEQ